MTPWSVGSLAEERAGARGMSRSGTVASFEILLFALLFLGFLQLLNDFVANVYACGLLQTSIPAEIGCFILMLAPALLWFLRKVPTVFVVLTAGLMLASRLASLALDTRGKILAAGIGTAAFLLCFPALLWHLGNRRDRGSGPILGIALALATLGHVFLQAVHSGNDITGFGNGRYLGGALAAVAGLLLWAWGARAVETTTAEPTGTPKAGTWRIAGLCVGMTAVLVLLYFGLAAPAVMTRWTGGEYLWTTAITAGTTALFLVLQLGTTGLRRQSNSRVLLGWNLVFLFALGLALWSSRVPFPADARGYPFSEPAVGPLGQTSMVLTLLLAPVLFVNFTWFARALFEASPSVRALGFGWTLGSGWLLLLVFAQVLTTVYDYVPVVGPWFRDRFWLVGFFAGAGAVLPVLLLRPETGGEEHPAREFAATPGIALGAVLALGAVTAVIITRAQPTRSPSRTALRVMTYNVQQGYSAKGRKNFAGQLEKIRQVNPDIVGLQETDSTRIAGGNSDLVRFLADRLNYHAHSGPRTGAGTFGIALLSRFPIGRAQTFYLYSTGEQTAVLTAELTAGGTTYQVFVTHLGNGGPAIQQREILELVADRTNVILMGDFNFRPGAEPYRLTSERLADAWLAADEKRLVPPDQNLDRRIDHVFVSPGTPVLQATYLDDGDSDHPALVVEVAPPSVPIAPLAADRHSGGARPKVADADSRRGP